MVVVCAILIRCGLEGRGVRRGRSRCDLLNEKMSRMIDELEGELEMRLGESGCALPLRGLELEELGDVDDQGMGRFWVRVLGFDLDLEEELEMESDL